MTLRPLLALLPALLAACAAPGPVRDAPDWDERRTRLLAADRWALRGRVAWRDAGGEGGQANLRWEQSGETSELRFAGPFGAGAWKLTLEPGRVSLSDAGGDRSVAYSGSRALESFLREQLGWSFPAAAARYWMLGLADPSARARERFDAAGRLAMIEQHGWDVTYERWADFDAAPMPTRLTLENPRARLRVIVTDWTISPAPTGFGSSR